MWVVLSAVSAILALAGPFETGSELNFGERAAYWTALTILSYALGLLCNRALGRHPSETQRWSDRVLIGLATGLGVLVLVTGLNWIALGFVPQPSAWPVYAGTIIAIALIISVLVDAFIDTDEQPPQERGTPAYTPPALLSRLPLDKRGTLLAISVEDHYVRVVTDKGEELLLMRLSDAIREVGDTRGAQVHRSHWAAFDAVTSVKRDGARALLTLSNGLEIPVSRANLSKIKEAGLLPR